MRKRALVVVLTNFRDEDAAELEPALKLLRTPPPGAGGQPARARAARDRRAAAAARRATRSRWPARTCSRRRARDAFAALAGRDALTLDVEPAQLAVALVNRYHAVKRAGLL